VCRGALAVAVLAAAAAAAIGPLAPEAMAEVYTLPPAFTAAGQATLHFKANVTYTYGEASRPTCDRDVGERRGQLGAGGDAQLRKDSIQV
jgi:hypothetical protein